MDKFGLHGAQRVTSDGEFLSDWSANSANSHPVSEMPPGLDDVVKRLEAANARLVELTNYLALNADRVLGSRPEAVGNSASAGHPEPSALLPQAQSRLRDLENNFDRLQQVCSRFDTI
jgi:hypothetical protein